MFRNYTLTAAEHITFTDGSFRAVNPKTRGITPGSVTSSADRPFHMRVIRRIGVLTAVTDEGRTSGLFNY